MGSNLTVRPARAEELGAAFQLLFQRVRDEDREARVANALYLLDRGELQRDGVLVVPEPHGMLGALVCISMPGASGLVWPPQVRGGPWRREVEDALLRQARAWLHQRGAKIAQALLPAEEAYLAEPLLRNRFIHATRLQYLHHHLQDISGPSSSFKADRKPRLSFRPFGDVDLSLFQQTLLRTYEDTLDCPELNGVRPIEEIIAGHRAQGLHESNSWWLALEAEQPCGVLLLADIPDLGGWDLSYLGVVPEARRRGIGYALAGKALAEARGAGAPRLMVAVDQRNIPARRLYDNLGFQLAEQREVYLTFLSDG